MDIIEAVALIILGLLVLVPLVLAAFAIGPLMGIAMVATMAFLIAAKR